MRRGSGVPCKLTYFLPAGMIVAMLRAQQIIRRGCIRALIPLLNRNESNCCITAILVAPAVSALGCAPCGLPGSHLRSPLGGAQMDSAAAP